MARLTRDHLQATGTGLADFEDAIGYSVEAALADPEEFRKFNVDGLRALCDAIDIDWFDVLDGL